MYETYGVRNSSLCFSDLSQVQLVSQTEVTQPLTPSRLRTVSPLTPWRLPAPSLPNRLQPFPLGTWRYLKAPPLSASCQHPPPPWPLFLLPQPPLTLLHPSATPATNLPLWHLPPPPLPPRFRRAMPPHHP